MEWLAALHRESLIAADQICAADFTDTALEAEGADVAGPVMVEQQNLHVDNAVEETRPLGAGDAGELTHLATAFIFAVAMLGEDECCCEEQLHAPDFHGAIARQE